MDKRLSPDFSGKKGFSGTFRAKPNLFNHPNFALPNNSLSNPVLFGQSTQMLGRGLEGLSPIYQLGGPRSIQLALNAVARNVFKILVEDTTTGEWLFTNRDGKPMKAIKKGFTAACVRAEIEDLRPYDLRHTFATRLLDRGVHQNVISVLLGHAMPLTGFGHASRITPGYAHATWEAMVSAVESLEQPVPKQLQQVFGSESGKSLANQSEERKVG